MISYKICEHCGKEFTAYRSDAIHCPNCKNITDITCKACGRTFIGRRGRRYCVECKTNMPSKEKVCSRCGKIYKPDDTETDLCYTCRYIKKCAICGKEFKARRSKTIICEDCGKKYKLTQRTEYPNMCAYCGKFIKDDKALCKDCYNKSPHKYDIRFVDFKS